MVPLRRPLLRAAVLLPAALAAGALVAPGTTAAASPPGCGPIDVAGGEWRSWGHDSANTRSQPQEKSIAPADAALLSPAWTFSTEEAGAEGDVTGTPVVADGCVYLATTRGWVFALNADDGRVVWKTRLPFEGGVFGSVAVGDGRIYAGVSSAERTGRGCPGGSRVCEGPYATALDQRTGKLLWATPPLDTQPGSDLFGSAIFFKGVVIFGISGGSAELGDEADRYAFQGSIVFISARTGRVLRKTWTIHPPRRPDDEFAGGGVWSAPAIDRRAKVAYVGTANPFQPQAEHERTNAVLKLDVDRRSPTFGRILDSYKGNVDEYFPGVSELPCYDIPGNPPPYYPQGVGSCGDLDMDFGASPNIFRDPSGRKMVGAGQKSGVYHVFDAKTMERAWTQIVGPPSAVGGIVGSTAYDGQSIFGPITVPGYLWSLDAADGSHRWLAPVADALHWGPPVSVANGVVYSVDLKGFLDAFDARTGALLAKRPLMLGGSGPASLSWGGVSIARNTIYAAVGMGALPQGFVVALRPGGPEEAVGDVEETIGNLAGGGGGGGGAPAGTAVIAGPGAYASTYATPVMVTRVGGPLDFTNLDIARHDVTARETGPDGRPLFHTKLIGLGETTPVEGLDGVESGKSYAFYCTIHPGMFGTLVVR